MHKVFLFCGLLIQSLEIFAKSTASRAGYCPYFDASQYLQVFSNPLDYRNHIVISKNGLRFVSLDCGYTFKPILGKYHNIENIRFNKFDPNLVLASSRVECKKKEIDCISHYSLQLSTNKGKSWVTIKSFVYDYDW